MAEYKRNCPTCNKKLTYTSTSGYTYSNKINSNCNSCSHIGKMKILNEKKYERFCPKCIVEVLHTTKYRRDLAIKNESLCRSCSQKGRILSEDHIKNISISMSGKNNPFYGKKRPEFSKLRMGHEVSNETRKKLSIANTGNIHTEKTKKKQRISAIRRIERIELNGGQLIPNYNPDACKIIENYGKENGYNFQHAENGGEVRIGGYYPDGLDENRKTIIEVDESHHFKNGELRKKDIKRQTYLESLGYDVIRIKLNRSNISYGR